MNHKKIQRMTALALFAGIISAFVDNVATVLMVAPVGRAAGYASAASPSVPAVRAEYAGSAVDGEL